MEKMEQQEGEGEVRRMKRSREEKDSEILFPFFSFQCSGLKQQGEAGETLQAK